LHLLPAGENNCNEFGPLAAAMTLRLVLASANPAKAAEIDAIVAALAPGSIELVPRPVDVPDVVEDADTFEGNARLKAVALVEATGLPALADDSGLVVDALGGAPGVRSARYAGESATDGDNRDRLLRELEGATDRAARFVCTVMVRWPDGHEVVATGEVAGRIAEAPAGSGGFGYDPVFVPDEGDGRTFGQFDPAAKHAISHRGRALRALVERLR
jgi:XTP/dITP diphosphohydrolase